MNGGNFLDSNVFIYLFDQTDLRKKAIATRIVEEESQAGTGAISYQVVQETLNAVTRRTNPVATRADAETFLNDVLVPLWRVNPSLALFQRGLSLEARFRFSFYDSLIVAAALESGCDRLLTEDLQHGQQIEGLTIHNPFR